jgi:two-component system NarL family sensor kinase
LRFRTTYIFSTFILFLFYTFCSAQNLDSLETLFKNAKSDTTKLRLLNNLADQCEVENMEKYLKPSIDISEKNLKTTSTSDTLYSIYQQYLAAALNNYGYLSEQKGEVLRALKYYDEALDNYEKAKNEEGKATTLNNIAIIYNSRGDISRALDAWDKALRIQERIDDKEGAARSLNNIGSVYAYQDDHEKAIESFKKAIAIDSQTKNKRGLAYAYNNLGVIYNKKADLDRSLEYHFEALKLKQEMKDNRGIGNSFINIGYVFANKKALDTSMSYFKRGLSVLEAIQDKASMATCLNGMAETQVKFDRVKEAKAYAERALTISKELGYPEQIKNAAGILKTIYQKQDQPQKAYEMLELYTKMHDSISNRETRLASLKKQFQYDYEKKEAASKLEQDKKDAVAAEEIKRHKQINWLSAGALVLILLSSLLFFNRYRLKQKNKFQQKINEQQKEQANAVMETQEQERKRIAEDLHDSLGHLLSTTKLNLQTLPGGQKQIDNSIQLLNQASEEIRNITFNLMPRTLEEGGLIPALNELASKVTNSGSVKVLLNVHDMDKFVLEKQSQFNIYRIVQEAVNNILKHAAATEINIQVIGQSDHITIMIEDDGKGFDMGSQKNGRGLKNIVTRSLWLKGSLNIDSRPGHGTTITTEFPV